MLERDIQGVDLDDVDSEMEVDADEIANDKEEEAFEKALHRDDNTYHQSLDATQIYLNEIGFSPLLTPEEEVHYGRLAQKGDPAGRQRMIESNLRLVVKIARRYLNRGLSLLELISEGNAGLIKAAERFDGERGVKHGEKGPVRTAGITPGPTQGENARPGSAQRRGMANREMTE